MAFETVALDDIGEEGVCSICGTRIQLGQRMRGLPLFEGGMSACLTRAVLMLQF
jgi:hypothetical protein